MLTKCWYHNYVDFIKLLTHLNTSLNSFNWLSGTSVLMASNHSGIIHSQTDWLITLYGIRQRIRLRPSFNWVTVLQDLSQYPPTWWYTYHSHRGKRTKVFVKMTLKNIWQEMDTKKPLFPSHLNYESSTFQLRFPLVWKRNLEFKTEPKRFIIVQTWTLWHHIVKLPDIQISNIW